MERKLIFNRASSTDFGIRINGVNPYGAPERVVTAYEVPGRNGALVQDEGYFKNYTLQYDAAIFRAQHEAEQITTDIKRWLMADVGYHRLEDNYCPDIYRMARYVGGFDPTMIGSTGRSFKFPMSFDCMPQKFLKSGENAIEIPANTETVLHNPTGFTAYPLIRVKTNAIFGVSETKFVSDGYSKNFFAITHMPAGREIEVDTETTEAIFTDNGSSANEYVAFEGKLILGAEKTFVRGTGSVEIIPRWWRI